MRKIYRKPLDNIFDEHIKNKDKAKFKDRVMREFLDEFSIADVKTIKFIESEEREHLTLTTYYYVEIETSEF